MGSSLVKIDVHVVFHVKRRRVVMRNEDLPRIFQYFGGIIRSIDAIPIEVGGICNHIHILASLPKSMSASNFVRTIKAYSSKWIKTIDDYYETFAWQDGYGAFSVSPTLLDTTARYIQNQKQHHEKRSFEDEYKLFLEKHSIPYNEKYVFD